MAIRELGKNKYKIELVIGYNGTKRIRHYEVFIGNKKDALLRESELKIQLKNDTFIKKNRMIMKDLINEWLIAIQNKVAIKTYKTYELYSKNIVKCLGHIQIKNINAKILEDFYNELRKNTTFSDKTIKHHYSIISTVFNNAIKWGYISTNPNDKVDKIKVKKTDIKCYNPNQVENLVNALLSESLKYQSLILLALDSGCRRGELTGLTWNDVDFVKSTINVNKTTQYVSDIGIFEKSTKSDTSNRVIYISQTTLNVLRKYQVEQYEHRLNLGDKWLGSKRVFTTDFGADMHPDTPSQILEKIIKRHNLDKISFHGLRHTSISLQIASGIQAQIISKRAGHSSLATTHNIYSHFFESGFKDVAEKMDSFLNVSNK